MAAIIPSPDPISMGINILGSLGEAQGAASTAERARQLDKQKYKARKAAYENMIAQSRNDLGAGEQAFTGEANQALPELGQMETDIANQNARELQQGAGQMQLGLAQQGVRGAQAATQLRRGLGDMAIGSQENVNKLKYDEAAQRAMERRSYYAGKARQGQAASYTPATF